MVLCDYIFVLQSVIYQCRLICATTNLCVVLCVDYENVRMVLYITVCNIVYCDQSEYNRVGNVYCIYCDPVIVCNIVYCDRAGDVYCVNCDNLSEVL